MAQFPNYYSTTLDFTLSTGGSTTLSFGFNADFLRILNRGGATAYFNLKGAVATTKDLEVLSSGEMPMTRVPKVAGLGILSTVMQSTTTGVAAIFGIVAVADL